MVYRKGIWGIRPLSKRAEVFICENEKDLEEKLQSLKNTARQTEYFQDRIVVRGLTIYHSRHYKQLKPNELGCYECGKVSNIQDIKTVKDNTISYKCPCGVELGWSYNPSPNE